MEAPTKRKWIDRERKGEKGKKNGKEIEREHTQYSKTQQKDKLHFCVVD